MPKILASSTHAKGKGNDCCSHLHAGKEGLLDEDYTEEQADQELAPLNAQLAYVSAACAEQQAALDTYQVYFPSCEAGTDLVCLHS